MILKQTIRIWNVTDGIYDCESAEHVYCLLIMLWYFSYTGKVKPRSARCIVRWLICLHMVQVLRTAFWTMIYPPQMNQKSPKYFCMAKLYLHDTLTGDCNSNLDDCTFAFSMSVILASVLKKREVLSGEMPFKKIFLCQHQHTQILLSQLNRPQHLWELMQLSSAMMWRGREW